MYARRGRAMGFVAGEAMCYRGCIERRMWVWIDGGGGGVGEALRWVHRSVALTESPDSHVPALPEEQQTQIQSAR